MRIGEVFVECGGKMGFPGFGFFRHGDNRAFAGARTAPGGKMQLVAGSKDGGSVYTDRHPGSQMEISV